MTDVSADTGPPPVFGPDGRMMGNLTSDQGQPPAPPGALAPQSPLAALGPPPAATAGPPPQQSLNMPPKPQMGEQQKLGPAPDAKDYQQNAMAFAGAMAVLGAVASRFTRMSGTNALNAFAGALNGWKTGNLEQYELAAKKWEQDTKTTLENNRLVMEKYKLALEDRKMNIDEQMSQIQLVSAQYHDKMMYDAAATKNYTLVAQIYGKNEDYTRKASEAAAKLQEKRDEQKIKNEQSATYWLSPEGQQRLPTLSMAQQAGVKQLIEIYGQKQVGKSAIAQDRQQYINEFTAENGRAPTSAEITKWEGQRAGATAYGRTAGSMGARVESASNEVEQLIPQAVETSHAYLRGKIVSFNKVKNAINAGVSDETFNDFELANFSLINAYTRAMNPQGVPRVTERLEQHALGILSTAISPQAYDTQIRRLWKEVQASKTATAKTAEGRSAGDINAPVPGMDFNDRFKGGSSGGDDGGGWGKASVVGQ